MDDLNSVSFEKIINKMIMQDGWIRSDAEKTCDLFKKFLLLKKKYPSFKHLVPSEDVDEFWHAVILDTAFYRKMCKEHFITLFPDKDGFLDHYPYFGIDDQSDKKLLTDSFQKTQDLFKKEFGQEMVPTRSKYPKVVYWFLRKLN